MEFVLIILLSATVAILVWVAGVMAALSEMRQAFEGAVIEVESEDDASKIKNIVEWSGAKAMIDVRPAILENSD